MYLAKVDPRSLKENPDRARQTKSTPQADALLLASIKAVGIVQPPVVAPEVGGGNGYTIDAGHRRVRQAIAADLEEIEVLIDEAANDNGAMRSVVENIAREPLNPVDQWRAIERLVALGWTEEAIGAALALPVRQIKKLRLLANVLPAMLDHMAKGDMPNENQLRTIAAASLDEQKEVWKKHKPSKAVQQVTWYNLANALTKTRMYARHASFGDELATAYGIAWVDDLFAPADEDGRYTNEVEAFLGAQQEWMTNNLPKRGVIAEVNSWGQPVLPPKAQTVYGKPSKGDRVALYLDRDGRVQSAHFRLPEQKGAKGGKAGGQHAGGEIVTAKPRPEVTRKGVVMIGDFRTDALHDALARAPIEDETLMALLVLALAGQNVSIASGVSDGHGYAAREGTASSLVSGDGDLIADPDTLRVAARTALINVLSCREDRTDSGIVARIAGKTIGADSFLPNMGTEDFLLCLSRAALERSCGGTSVIPRPRVRETRAALAEHFKEGRFVHPSALFAPDKTALAAWLSKNDQMLDEDNDETLDPEETDVSGAGFDADGTEEGFLEAAE